MISDNMHVQTGEETQWHEEMYLAYKKYLKEKGLPKEQIVQLLEETELGLLFQNRIFAMLLGIQYGKNNQELTKEVSDYIDKLIG